MSKTLPLVIFGLMGIIAGAVALWLPETLYSSMPQTVEEAEAWKEDYKIYCCKHHRNAREELNVNVMMDSNNQVANESDNKPETHI